VLGGDAITHSPDEIKARPAEIDSADSVLLLDEPRTHEPVRFQALASGPDGSAALDS
jgi:hypothetical protein